MLLRILSLLLIAGLGFPGAAAAFELDRVFSISAKGIKLGEMDVSVTSSNGRYAVNTHIYPTGLAGLLLEYEMRGSSSGVIDGQGNPQPRNYELWARERDNESTTRITYQGNRIASISSDYQLSGKLSSDGQTNTLDPVTAVAVLVADTSFERLCNKTYDMYGGARRIRITAYRPKEEGDGLWLCNGIYQTVQGDSNTERSAGRDTSFKLYFRQREDGMMTLERIRVHTNAGWVVGTAKD